MEEWHCTYAKYQSDHVRNALASTKDGRPSRSSVALAQADSLLLHVDCLTGPYAALQASRPGVAGLRSNIQRQHASCSAGRGAWGSRRWFAESQISDQQLSQHSLLLMFDPSHIAWPPPRNSNPEVIPSNISLHRPGVSARGSFPFSN